MEFKLRCINISWKYNMLQPLCMSVLALECTIEVVIYLYVILVALRIDPVPHRNPKPLPVRNSWCLYGTDNIIYSNNKWNK